MPLFTWLHITDLHASAKIETESKNNWSYNRRYQLIQDIIRTLNSEKITDLDCIFFTGDLSFSGEAAQFKYDEDRDGGDANIDCIDTVDYFVTTLLSKLEEGGFKKPALYCVPGNHDLEVSKMKNHNAKAFQADVVSKYNEIANSPNLGASNNDTQVSSPVDLDAVKRKFWQSNGRLSKRGSLFVNEALANYSSWSFDKMPSDIQKGVILGDFSHTHTISDGVFKGKTIGIVGLNSTYSHVAIEGLPFKDPNNELIMSSDQLKEVTDREPKRWFEKNKLNILLTHHPLQQYVRDFHKDGLSDKFSEFALSLHGHRHLSSAETSVDASQKGVSFTGTSLQGEQFEFAGKKVLLSGYNIGVIDADTEKSVFTYHNIPRVNFDYTQSSNFSVDPFAPIAEQSNRTDMFSIKNFTDKDVADITLKEAQSKWDDSKDNGDPYLEQMKYYLSATSAGSKLYKKNVINYNSTNELAPYANHGLRIILLDNDSRFKAIISNACLLINNNGAPKKKELEKHLIDLFTLVLDTMKELPREDSRRGSEPSENLPTIIAFPRMILTFADESYFKIKDCPSIEIKNLLTEIKLEEAKHLYIFLPGTFKSNSSNKASTLELCPLRFDNGNTDSASNNINFHANLRNGYDEDKFKTPGNATLRYYTVDDIKLIILIGYSIMDISAVTKIISDQSRQNAPGGNADKTIIYAPAYFKAGQSSESIRVRSKYLREISLYLNAVIVSPCMDGGEPQTFIYYRGAEVNPKNELNTGVNLKTSNKKYNELLLDYKTLDEIPSSKLKMVDSIKQTIAEGIRD